VYVCVCVCVCVCPVSNQSWCSVKLLDFSDSRCETLETNSVHSSYSQRSSKENLCTTRNQAGLGALEFDDVISLNIVSFR
jgi:hypothetical protein